MSYDRILSHVGDLGPYQISRFVLAMSADIPKNVQLAHLAFLTQEPAFRCAVPGLANDTYHIQNEAHRELVNSFIPIDSDTSQYSHCEAYAGYWNGSDIFNRSQTVACDRWVYDHSTASNSLVPEFDLVCDRKIIKSHMAMALMTGLLVGSLFGGTLSDYFGRKFIMMVTTSIWIAVAIGLAFVQSALQVIVFKFISSSLTIAYILAFFVLVTEIVEPSKRGQIGFATSFSFTTGMAVCTLIYYLCQNWRTAQLVASVPTVLLLSLWWLIDESPRWLMIKGKVDKALTIIKKMAKMNKVTSTEGFDKALIEDVTENEEPKVTQDKVWTILTNKVMLLRLAILGVNWGVIIMCFYGFTLNVGDSIMPGSLHLNMILQCVMEVASNFFCIYCIGKMGRKPLYCGLIFLAGTSCLLGAILPVVSYDQQWIQIVVISVGRFGMTGAFGSIYVVTAEMIPTTSRNFGLGLCSLTGRVFGVIAPYIGALGLLIPGKFGQKFPLFIFGIACILCGLSIFLLPETRNRKLPDTINDASKLSNKNEIPHETQEMITPVLNGNTETVAQE